MNIGDPDVSKIEEALASIRRYGAVLDAHLQARQYIVGTTLTVADLTIASSLMYAKQTDAPVADFPPDRGAATDGAQMLRHFPCIAFSRVAMACVWGIPPR
jgi:glutathione S-transferase